MAELFGHEEKKETPLRLLNLDSEWPRCVAVLKDAKVQSELQEAKCQIMLAMSKLDSKTKSMDQDQLTKKPLPLWIACIPFETFLNDIASIQERLSLSKTDFNVAWLNQHDCKIRQVLQPVEQILLELRVLMEQAGLFEWLGERTFTLDTLSEYYQLQPNLLLWYIAPHFCQAVCFFQLALINATRTAGQPLFEAGGTSEHVTAVCFDTKEVFDLYWSWRNDPTFLPHTGWKPAGPHQYQSFLAYLIDGQQKLAELASNHWKAMMLEFVYNWNRRVPCLKVGTPVLLCEKKEHSVWVRGTVKELFSSEKNLALCDVENGQIYAISNERPNDPRQWVWVPAQIPGAEQIVKFLNRCSLK